MINAILRLRRDNEFNYDKIKNSFIPADGEICLVDTARDGLRAVCGDGKTVFGELEYLNELIQKGYYNNGVFYKDAEMTQQLKAMAIRIYIDLKENEMYHFNGETFIKIGTKVPTATAELPGILKLYTTTGHNEDGTMTQKAITDELDTKVELTLKEEEELIIFSL